MESLCQEKCEELPVLCFIPLKDTGFGLLLSGSLTLLVAATPMQISGAAFKGITGVV